MMFAVKVMGLAWFTCLAFTATVIGLEELNLWRARRHVDHEITRGIANIERYLEEV